ncbi:MAG: hypothetical protein ACYC6Y_31990 [Thermoguttaceae bacterium]
MKSRTWSLTVVSIVAGMFCACATADDLAFIRQHDAWGRYQPGAWTLVRVKTEAFNEAETLESVTETRTTLAAVDELGITLKMEVGVKIGGKEIETRPQSISQGFHGELSTVEPLVTDMGEGEVVIENRRVHCRVQKLEFPRPVGRKVTTIYYSSSVEPYVLRQETSVYAGTNDQMPTSETTVQVVSLAVPCRLWKNFRSASRVKTIQKDASGTTTTWTWMSSLVPGGVICYTSQQVDNDGRLVCYREMQLLDYGLQQSSERGGPMWRMRTRRVK